MYFRNPWKQGSCVVKASVGRYIGRDVGRHSTDMLTDTRRTCRLTLDRYVGQNSTDMSIDTRLICWLISASSQPTCMLADTRSVSNRHSTDTLPTLGRHTTNTWSALNSLLKLHFCCSLHWVSALWISTLDGRCPTKTVRNFQPISGSLLRRHYVVLFYSYKIKCAVRARY